LKKIIIKNGEIIMAITKRTKQLSANPAIYIAAANTPNSLKNRADYVCSGIDDNLIIQAIINIVETEGMANGYPCPIFFANGSYNLSAGLVIGANGTKYAPSLYGLGTVMFDWKGSDANGNWMLRWSCKPGGSPKIALSNLMFNGRKRASCIFMESPRWGTIIEHCRFYYSREWGLSAQSCWGAIFNSLYFSYGRGTALRLHSHNGGSLLNTAVTSYVNTFMPTREEGGGALVRIQGYNEPSDGSSCGIYDGMMFESNVIGSYPHLLISHGYDKSFRDIRGESCQSNNFIEIDNCIGVNINNTLFSGVASAPSIGSIVKMTGKCERCAIDRIRAHYISKSVVEIGEGCIDTVIERIEDRSGIVSKLLDNLGIRTLWDNVPQTVVIFNNIDTTPNVCPNNRPWTSFCWSKDANASIIGFKNCCEGQLITIICESNNITLVHNTTSLVVKGEANRILGIYEVVQFICKQGIWYEV
jgi:hypothetical protein